jgi:hypothetical protein
VAGCSLCAGGWVGGGLAVLWGIGPVGWWTVAEWRWQPACAFSVLWCGKVFHRLVVQGANVSGLPCALPHTCLQCLSKVPDS